ncbi:MAG: hypothetical protein JWQ98_514 [Chlorobi bacterium]|nr:hypothetical protein [Chlorobiota bacterium]
MTKIFVTRALLIAGLAIAGSAASFAQTSMASSVRRVDPSKENQQPVPASTVLVANMSALNLTAQQQTQVASMDKEVAALTAERAQLWSEYRAIKARPDFSDDMAAAEAAPRMHRIVAINAQLAPVAARQDGQVAALLSSNQYGAFRKMVASAKSSL